MAVPQEYVNMLAFRSIICNLSVGPAEKLQASRELKDSDVHLTCIWGMMTLASHKCLYVKNNLSSSPTNSTVNLRLSSNIS